MKKMDYEVNDDVQAPLNELVSV